MDTMQEYDTFSKWLVNSLDRDWIIDLATSGAINGVPGLIYYSETSALYAQYEIEIWEALAEDAEAFGYASPLEFVATLNGGDRVDGPLTFKNLCVWYMAEREAQRLVESGGLIGEGA